MSLPVVLVDDHPLFRDGLREVLARAVGVRVAGEFDATRDLYDFVAQRGPCLAVLDLALPGLDGFAATRGLLRIEPRCRVLILTVSIDEQSVLRAFGAGAMGYATKDQPAEQVVEAVCAVARGERYLAPQLPRAWLAAPALGAGATPGWLRVLTPRELDVAELVLRGLSTAGIATELGISGKTVEVYRGNILRKLSVNSAAALIRLAAESGYPFR